MLNKQCGIYMAKCQNIVTCNITRQPTANMIVKWVSKLTDSNSSGNSYKKVNKIWQQIDTPLLVLFTGALLDASGSYMAPFGFAGALYIGCGVCYALLPCVTKRDQT